jgi:hypothetical protein
MFTHHFSDLCEILALGDLITNEVDDLLRRETIPDAFLYYEQPVEKRRFVHTIASQDEEFIFLSDIMASNVGVGGDDLLLRSHVVVFLEFEITQSPGKGKIAYICDKDQNNLLDGGTHHLHGHIRCSRQRRISESSPLNPRVR